jgi:microcystin-dependent protein
LLQRLFPPFEIACTCENHQAHCPPLGRGGAARTVVVLTAFAEGRRLLFLIFHLPFSLSLMDEAYIGSIVLFGGNFAPKNWAFCDGSLINISQNSALYAILGTTYGGDGRTTFALPDLRNGQAGPGQQAVQLGERGGSNAVTLSSQQMPIHTHLQQVATQAATTSAPSNTVVPGSPNGITSVSEEAVNVNNMVAASGATLTPLSPNAIGTAGGSQPVSVMQPYLGLNYIICLYGLYPSRN